MLDLLVLLEAKVKESEREEWRRWIWDQQISGEHGTGFRPGPSTAVGGVSDNETANSASTYDQPHLVMTYAALLSLSILRDDFSKLDRDGILRCLRAAQKVDGSLTPTPGWGESDVRLVYCAFVISYLLNDWSGFDVPKAIDFVKGCRSYEGGYGQTPGNEAQGGSTYCCIASLALASSTFPQAQLSDDEKEGTIRWLTQRQTGGFQGRTEKTQDACYSFWCGAALNILGAGELVNVKENAEFLAACQFKFGGIAKFPDETPDPYHSYLSLACLAIYPPNIHEESEDKDSWTLPKLDPLVNARVETAQWAREHVPRRNSTT
ncbi:hypothetical protein FRB90_005882 [Tulasnella sp. 427]|nr:hypothetical protein FRB90_005882 [Tulasnella sp. 427]